MCISGKLGRHSTVPRVAGCEIGTYVFACAQHDVYRIRVSKRAAHSPLQCTAHDRDPGHAHAHMGRRLTAAPPAHVSD